ncbi:MAG: hypothetical protein HYX24_02170 [Candidatus Aenigmarchaeota archaeon]|nr:hypothetical protein [Candidatus Aenigmarchaeota archaeon]
MEKIRVYLDTNMIHDLFTRQASALKREAGYEKPKKFAFMLENADKFEFVTSFLSKAEIMREMVSAHGMKPELVNHAWSEFMETLNPKYITEFIFDEQIVDIVSIVKMKLRTMINFFHLFIAIKEQAYFVSGDKQIMEKIKETGIYDKLLTYVDMQKLAANYPYSSDGVF